MSEVDWEEAPLQRWLGGIVKDSTKRNYKSAFRAYAEYTKLNSVQLIDEAVVDSKSDVREKKAVVLNHIIGFYNYLKKDYVVKSRGNREHSQLRNGLSDNLATTYTAAVRSFYATYEITLRMKGRHQLPKPKVTNKRMIVAAEQVKILLNNARTPRDRAIMLFFFQGGLDASTLCSLVYGDVAEGLAKNEVPLKLSPQRVKTGVEFYTFLGKDAIEALRVYIKDAETRGVQFSLDSPLFVTEKGKEAVEPNNVQTMMKEVAIKAGFIDTKLNGKAFNMLGPYALRESFSSIMSNAGVPDSIVDFWLGHEIGELADAYKQRQYEELRRIYIEKEKLLTVYQQNMSLEELEKKVDAKVDDKIATLQKVISKYAAKNIDLTEQLKAVTEKVSAMEEEFRWIHEEVKFFKEDGIEVAYVKELDEETKNDIRQLIQNSQKQKE